MEFRIKENTMKSILYINRNTDPEGIEKSRKVKMTAILRKIRMETQKKAEEGQETDNGPEALPENAEMLMFRGFSRNEVGMFLNDLKKAGVRIDLKCMETESNKTWTLKKLYEELKEEHEALH